MLPGRVLEPDMISGGDRRRSGALIASGFTKIVSPPYNSSTVGAIPGGVPQDPLMAEVGCERNMAAECGCPE